MCRTKIVATLGPACDSPEMIRRMINAGVTVFRLNFSHGSQEMHQEYIGRIRSAERDLGEPVAIMMDLQGPKIRTGPLANGEPVRLLPGHPFTITTREVIGSDRCVGTSYSALPGDVKKGDRLLVSDGLIELKVEEIQGSDIHCTVRVGGILSQRQGINLPGVPLTAPSLTEKDMLDLAFGVNAGVDFVAISFVRSPDCIIEARAMAAAQGKAPWIIAKIERPEALAAFRDIVSAADGIMVARGDLGVEISAERVPIVQKQLIAIANSAGKPVITATQMLDSMIRNPRPTRAEVSDVANAIIDGTDAVMLSGETATGCYPLEAVQMLARIAPLAESHIPLHSRVDPQGSLFSISRQPVPSTSLASLESSTAIAEAACALSRADFIRAIVVFTQSGLTARLISRERPDIPIIALTPDSAVYRQMALVWGVRPMLIPFDPLLDILEKKISLLAAERGLAQPGQQVVMVGGHPLPAKEPTNFLKILTVSTVETKGLAKTSI
ncbi:pyruvate kinase [bacterium]|nr:pyruvate kinase [candidate division CSSED10-310 bacterium]